MIGSDFHNLINLTIANREDIDEHLLTLFSLTVSMKPQKIIELGVRSARSTYAFLLASQLIDAKLLSVDIQNPVPSLPISDSMKERWTFLRSDALRFLEDSFESEWPEASGNILYIDDWHSGDHVQKELDLVKDCIKPNDIILLHDLMYGNSQPHYRSVDSPQDKQWDNGGPYRPVANLDLTVWEYVTIPRCHGMTILRKKSDKVIDV
mgnify:CR=1 FL=1|tara:strand:- start:7674 stop:8297 length:624 start_codon:yes stop_codon:yes gene_type:complete